MRKFIHSDSDTEVTSLRSRFRAFAGDAAIIAGSAFFTAACVAASQNSPPNLEGVWDRAVSTSNIYEYMANRGTVIPFTALGAERYRNVDVSQNPNGFCLPPGPSRMITGPSPFQIVQGTEAIAILNENHGVYRIIHMDGKGYPEEIFGYPEFMGYSVGRWEGEVLMIDTVGIREETWLDSEGLPHSEDLRLTEIFERMDPDTIRYTVTYEDPEIYAHSWTLEAGYVRQDTRIIEYVCTENEKDNDSLVPTFPHRDLDIKVFSGDEQLSTRRR